MDQAYRIKTEDLKLVGITPEELRQADQGMNLTGLSDKAQPKRECGILCPRCGGFIPVSISRLITVRYLTCPACALRLEIERTQGKDENTNQR